MSFSNSRVYKSRRAILELLNANDGNTDGITVSELVDKVEEKGFLGDKFKKNQSASKKRQVQRILIYLKDHAEFVESKDPKHTTDRKHWKITIKGKEALENGSTIPMGPLLLARDSLDLAFNEEERQRIEDAISLYGEERISPRFVERTKYIRRAPSYRSVDIPEDVRSVIYNSLDQINPRIIEVDYKSPRIDMNGEQVVKKKLRLEPFGIVFRNEVPYLIARSPEKTIRHYAMHRFSNAREIAKNVSNYNKDILGKYIKEQMGLPADPQQPELKLLFEIEPSSGNYLKERPIRFSDPIQVTEQGWLKVSATVPNTLDLRWWILGFGEKIKVIEPASLRDELRIILQNSLTHYL